MEQQLSLKFINYNTKVEENISNKCQANILIHKGYLKINKKKLNNSLSCVKVTKEVGNC